MATRIPRFRMLVPSAAVFIAAAAAVAMPDPAPQATCPAIDPPAAATVAGIRVFVDPATGKIRKPTPGERRKLAALVSLDRSARVYEIVTRPDGTRTVQLDETFMTSVVATRNPDGTMSYRCGSARAHVGHAGGGTMESCE
jgi:hypothetical protein